MKVPSNIPQHVKGKCRDCRIGSFLDYILCHWYLKPNYHIATIMTKCRKSELWIADIVWTQAIYGTFFSVNLVGTTGVCRLTGGCLFLSGVWPSTTTTTLWPPPPLSPPATTNTCKNTSSYSYRSIVCSHREIFLQTTRPVDEVHFLEMQTAWEDPHIGIKICFVISPTH